MKKLTVDGIRFTESTKIVVLPDALWAGELKNHLTFGKVCTLEKKGAVLTGSKNNEGHYIHALPIPFSGHSLTNMMYGKDGRIYLFSEGKCYSAPAKKAEAAK